MAWPDDNIAVAKAFAAHEKVARFSSVREVELLGHCGKLDHVKNDEVLRINLPETALSADAFVLKIRVSAGQP